MSRIGDKWTLRTLLPTKQVLQSRVARSSWPKTPDKVDLKSVRVPEPKPPRLPTLADRTERFLIEVSQETEDASKALNELAMMVTAEAIDRGIPAAAILTPIAIKCVGRWNIDQIPHEHMKLQEHRDSLTGGKTREGIVDMFLGLLADAEAIEAELEVPFEILTEHLKNDDVELQTNAELIYGHSPAFVDALERYGEGRLVLAMIRYFRRNLPELGLRATEAILRMVGTAGKTIARVLPKYHSYGGTDWVEKRATTLVSLHDAFHHATDREPPAPKPAPGYGVLCYDFLNEYSERFAPDMGTKDPEGRKGKEHEV